MPKNDNNAEDRPLMHFAVGRAPDFNQQHASVENALTDYPRITRTPGVMAGKPCIRGKRVTVRMITGQISAGVTIEELLADYPYLERDDILQAIGFAGEMAADPEYDMAGAN